MMQRYSDAALQRTAENGAKVRSFAKGGCRPGSKVGGKQTTNHTRPWHALSS